jgi:hypothetical protein
MLNRIQWQQLSRERGIFYGCALKMPGLVSGSVTWSRGVLWERSGWTIEEARQEAGQQQQNMGPPHFDLGPWAKTNTFWTIHLFRLQVRFF